MSTHIQIDHTDSTCVFIVFIWFRNALSLLRKWCNIQIDEIQGVEDLLCFGLQMIPREQLSHNASSVEVIPGTKATPPLFFV